ncbi:MAG TPA: serine/threonine-protein kinase [Pirellulales bacterium]|nr:serine/threonine-protein kinase [Pirellulales bacterium]
MSSSTSTTTPLLDPAGATVALEHVSARVDLLIGAWESPDRPPTLSKFLPDQPLEMRRLVLTELIKVDLEYRWQQHNLPKTVEEYLAEFPELAEAGKVPCDLIYEEFHIRRQLPQAPDPADYLRRFPAQEEQLRRMLDIHANHTTSTAVGRRRPPGDIGKQIDDFDVLLRLGEGAFAAVYLARQRSMQRLVALKVSRDHGTESQTLAQLDHPYIVRVYDQRILPAEKLRLMYMQHVPGGTLQDLIQFARNTPVSTWTGKTALAGIDAALERHGESPTESSNRRRLSIASWAEAVAWLGMCLADALDYAHRRGVLHRDVKPANVLLAADGSPKLADFNISFSSKLDGVTPAAYFGGSLAYMSPEQLEANDPDHERRPEDLDGRSDIYSLAVMLWELLTGTRPFGDERVSGTLTDTVKQLAERRRAGVPRNAIAALPRDLPPGLDQALLTCLAPNPADRPATGADAARQFKLCLQPRVQRLLRPRPGSLRQMMRDYPIWVFVVAGVIPHVVFSVLNLIFNYLLIVRKLAENAPNIKSVFWNQVLTVNSIAYILGVALAVYLVWPVIKAVRGYSRASPPDRESLPALCRRSLVVGDYITWLGFALWILSGFVFPIWLWLVGEHEPDKTQYYWYFFLSQVICGLIASTQTFFMITFVSVRGFHPLLVQLDRIDLEEIARLLHLDRRVYWYFGLAVAAPFLAFAVFGIINIEGTRWASVGLAAIGGVSSALVFQLLRAIQGDISALVAAVDPERAAPQSTMDSLDSFWSSSR